MHVKQVFTAYSVKGESAPPCSRRTTVRRTGADATSQVPYGDGPRQAGVDCRGRKGEGDPGRFNYCPFCGSQLAPLEKGGRLRPACAKCGFVQFRNPVPGVVVLMEKEGVVLLGKRRGGFGAGKWGLPQGYVEHNEDFLTAAIREVKEETGLDVEIRSILNVVSNLLAPGLHTLAIVLLAGVVAGELVAGDDLESLEWAPLSGPLPEMAFEADEYIIERYRSMADNEGLPVDVGFAR